MEAYQLGRETRKKQHLLIPKEPPRATAKRLAAALAKRKKKPLPKQLRPEKKAGAVIAPTPPWRSPDPQKTWAWSPIREDYAAIKRGERRIRKYYRDNGKPDKLAQLERLGVGKPKPAGVPEDVIQLTTTRALHAKESDRYHRTSQHRMSCEEQLKFNRELKQTGNRFGVGEVSEVDRHE